MLDLQRHIFCPIWTNIDQQVQQYDDTLQWTGLKYACQKVLETYSKVFEKQELFDLIVRYMQQYIILGIKQDLKSFSDTLSLLIVEKSIDLIFIYRFQNTIFFSDLITW